ncbi:MAG: C25 family cysteine peptidase [bacterium]|nr:C25 family cysteine peptidase [bacterium]
MYILLLFFLHTFLIRDCKSEIELLVIGREESRELATSFVDFKCKSGISAAFVSVEEIERRFTGFDLADKIRNGVRYYRENNGIRYLLLLGDFYRVPARIAYVRIGTNELSNNVPTDFYYAELYSDWDRNRNGLFGEQVDSINLIPNVMVGRIPYHNLAELEGYFTKVFNYKVLANDNLKFLLHSSDILGNGNSYKLTDSLSSVVPSHFALSKLYEISTSVNVTKNQYVDSVNSGPGYLFSCIHGDFGNLYINQTPSVSFGIADIHLLQSSVPSFWGILSCDIGGFDKDALGEYLLFSPSCIGILSQTRDGISNTISFYKRFFEYLFSDFRVSIGEADSAMRQAFSSEARNSLISYYSILTYNLLGDPTLIPIKRSYIDYKIKNITIFEDTGLVVRLRPLGPVSAKVNKKFVVYKRNEIIQVVETIEDSAYFRINPVTPGYLYIAITGPEISDIIDSVYVTPITLPIQFTLEAVSNEYGDTVLLSNAGFNVTIRAKNASPKYFENLKVVLKGYHPLILNDTLFTISLKPFEERSITARGVVVRVDQRGLAELEINTFLDSFENRTSMLFDYYVPVIQMTDLKVARRTEDLLVKVKIFNQNFYPVRDIKLVVSKKGKVVLARVENLPPFSDTTLYASLTLEDALGNLIIYYMRDSISFSIPGGSALLPPPTHLSGSSGIGSVILKWNSPGNGLLFNVYKSVDGINYRRANSTLINVCSFVDYEVNGPTYYYVTSVDTLLAVESGPSMSITLIPNPPFLDGWPRPVLGTGYSSPVVCELDRNLPGLEVVIATSFDSLVYAFDCAGRLLTGWPVNVHGTSLTAPAAGDLDGDGEEEVILITRDGTRSLHVLDKYGNEKPGFPIPVPGAIYSTPCLCDLDNDGLPEIVVKDGSFVKAFKNDGTFHVSPGLGGVGSSPACGDIDNDGVMEVVVSYSTDTSGYIGVLDAALNLKQGFPVPINKSQITSPSVGDILPDSSGLEIVVYAGDSLYLIDSNGDIVAKILVGGTTSWPYAISPAIGDVDGDGLKDIAIPTNYGFKVYEITGNFFSLIYGAYCGSGFSSCVIYDTDNDGRGEVFKGSVDGYLYAYGSTGQILPGFPVDLLSYAYITPQIWDINGDGIKELVVSSWGNHLFIFSTGWVSENLSWPMYKHDRYRSGNAEFGRYPVTASYPERKGIVKESKDQIYLIYDAMGRLIYRGDKNGFEQKVRSGSVRMGVYFIKSENQKFINKRVVIR